MKTVNMQQLFEMIAEVYQDGLVAADEIRPECAQLTFERPFDGNEARRLDDVTVELFFCTLHAQGKDSKAVQLVRVVRDSSPDVLVSPIPSAIIAVALR